MVRPLFSVVLLVAVGLAGCSNPPEVRSCDEGEFAEERRWRLQGRLDRDLTDAECAEFHDVAGSRPQLPG